MNKPSAAIHARDLRIDFPIMNSSHRSLKKLLMNSATGGRVASESGRPTVVTALGGVNFEIGAGERVALLGHNGSGKTTLLRALAGVYAPTGGELTVDGTISSLLDISLGIDPEATGVENIFLRGTLMGLSRRQIEDGFDGIAAFADLGDFLNLPVRTYSSGMQMRLAFAVSTSIHTDIVLLDEWLSVGDADFSAKASARLNGLVEQASILVLATHQPELMKATCARCIQLEHGQVIRDGPITVPA